MCLWEFLRVTIGTCVFCADGIMITNNSNNYHVFLNVFMFRIMSMTLRNINPQKEIFHHHDFPVYTTSKYRDPKLDTYRRITLTATMSARDRFFAACYWWMGSSRKLHVRRNWPIENNVSRKNYTEGTVTMVTDQNLYRPPVESVTQGPA